MKPKSALKHSSRLSRSLRGLLGRMTSNRKILLGIGAAAGLFLNGCAIGPGGGYYSDSGPYFGVHHFYGSSFGHGGGGGHRGGGGGHGR